MLTISKPLSAGQAQTYHKEEFANAKENYYSEGERISGEWQGRLAQEWGLRGAVQEEHFQRLAIENQLFLQLHDESQARSRSRASAAGATRPRTRRGKLDRRVTTLPDGCKPGVTPSCSPARL